MQAYFTPGDNTDQTLTASYVHDHQELTFEVAIRNEASPSLVITLPLETQLSLATLIRLAKSTLSQDFFEGRYLGFDGCDPQYGYTFEELLELLGLKPAFSVEGNTLVIRGIP